MEIVFRCDPALIDLLPRPMPAKAALPEWLRRMAPRVPSEAHGREIRTVKQCPPFVDAMAHGFVLPLPCDVTVEAGMKFAWDWPLPALTVQGSPALGALPGHWSGLRLTVPSHFFPWACQWSPWHTSVSRHEPLA